MFNQGDVNTKFFFLSTTQGHRRNKITALQDIRANWICEPSHVQFHISEYCQKLFTTELPFSTNSHSPTPITLSHRTIKINSCFHYKTMKFSKQSILSSLKGSRSRWTSVMFLPKYWADIQQSVTSFGHQIFRDHKIPHQINTTYLCLIPKNKNASSIT